MGSYLLSRHIRKTYFSEVKTTQGKINFLILGVNKGEAGGDLTDTMIFASINPQSHGITMISIPRDIWMEEIKAKINTAYHYAGISLVKKQTEEILGQNVDYYAVFNFDSFEKIIDYLGGIEVNVQRSFDDLKYPIAGKEKDLCNGDPKYGCRYEHLHFDAGLQEMDGKTALKFVRSRNAEGDEGTDFARSARQQLVIEAIGKKIISSKMYLSPEKLGGFLKIIQDNVITNITPQQYGSFGQIAYSLRNAFFNAKMVNLTEGELLIHPTYHYSKQWVLVSKSGHWESIHDYVQKAMP